jgi:hypothetical protein
MPAETVNANVVVKAGRSFYEMPKNIPYAAK